MIRSASDSSLRIQTVNLGVSAFPPNAPSNTDASLLTTNLATLQRALPKPTIEGFVLRLQLGADQLPPNWKQRYLVLVPAHAGSSALLFLFRTNNLASVPIGCLLVENHTGFYNEQYASWLFMVEGSCAAIQEKTCWICKCDGRINHLKWITSLSRASLRVGENPQGRQASDASPVVLLKAATGVSFDDCVPVSIKTDLQNIESRSTSTSTLPKSAALAAIRRKSSASSGLSVFSPHFNASLKSSDSFSTLLQQCVVFQGGLLKLFDGSQEKYPVWKQHQFVLLNDGRFFEFKSDNLTSLPLFVLKVSSYSGYHNPQHNSFIIQVQGETVEVETRRARWIVKCIDAVQHEAWREALAQTGAQALMDPPPLGYYLSKPSGSRIKLSLAGSLPVNSGRSPVSVLSVTSDPSHSQTPALSASATMHDSDSHVVFAPPPVNLQRSASHGAGRARKSSWFSWIKK
ncbi:hypothetical protein BC830DRAFT_1111032 [Chytriomyces sp. MP71]|nr:hypothetical protein BC830DRAFT_1111032 [Chytriomyces sp. MP71]